jgi:hypothetical protein
VSWTIDTLKEHTDERFAASEKAVAQALVAQKELYQTVQSAADKAITKAEDAQKVYNTGHNDLARKMEETYKQMLPRAEADARDKNLEEKLAEHGKTIASLNSRLDLIAGKNQGIDKFLGWIIAAVAVIGFIISNVKFK